MKVVQHASGATAIVAALDGYGAPDWTVIGDLPDGVRAEVAAVVGGKIVEDLTGPWKRLRERRNALLAESDWTQMSDQDATVKAAWKPYRKALKDLPAGTTDPLDPSWPEPPTS